MNWVLVLLLFDATTGELKAHSEQRMSNGKACEEAGLARTTDIAFEQPGYKMSYICLPPETFLEPAQPEPKPGKRGGMLGRIF